MSLSYQFQKGQTPWNKGFGENPKGMMERFNSKYTIQKNGCWDWIGQVYPNGYGSLWVRGKNVFAHRFSYQMFNGAIPEKLTVDHLCKNRKCVNPFHLDLTTRVDNVQRSNNEIANNKAKTHCPYGHEYNLENIYFRKNGHRSCIACTKRRARMYKLKLKLERRKSI